MGEPTILDRNRLLDSRGRVHFRHDRFFQGGLNIMGWIFILIGILGILRMHATMLFLVFGVIVVSSRSGMTVDIRKRRYRENIDLFGLRIGRWQSVEDFPEITILKVQMRYVYNSRVSSVSYKESSYGVYLITETHVHRILVASFSDLELAKEVASELSDLLGNPVVDYNPAERLGIRRRR